MKQLENTSYSCATKTHSFGCKKKRTVDQKRSKSEINSLILEHKRLVSELKSDVALIRKILSEKINATKFRIVNKIESERFKVTREMLLEVGIAFEGLSYDGQIACLTECRSNKIHALLGKRLVKSREIANLETQILECAPCSSSSAINKMRFICEILKETNDFELDYFVFQISEILHFIDNGEN